MAEKELLRIGELAKLANVTPRTIRFYIQEGILPQPVRIHKTMALYSRNCVNKLKAIKTAQNKFFLPLVVIRNILEQNQYDYESLINSAPYGATDKKSGPAADSKKYETDFRETSLSTRLSIPQKMITQMANHKWIKFCEKGKKTRIGHSDLEFLEQISILHNHGVSLNEQMLFFESIQDIIEKGVELELEMLIKSLIKKPNKYFSESLGIEGQVVQIFINKIRERCLQQYFKACAEVMDNAYCASADEGFALPAEEIMEDLQKLEASIDKRFPDVQQLIWLSTGYSCIGDLKRSIEVLRQALRIAPENLEAKVKMIWYKRFTKRRQDVNRLKSQLIELVRVNPKHTLGHIFLVDWFVLDALASNDASDMLESIKLCVDEIIKMEHASPQNHHDWALVQYTKGRVYTTFPVLRDDYMDEGILSFERLLKSRSALEKYYDSTMPFFLKWLWPNLLYLLGTAYLTVKRFSEAEHVFKMAQAFTVAFPFQERLERGLADAVKGSGAKP